MASDLVPSLNGRRIGLLTASASRLGGGVYEAVVHHAEMVRAAGGEPHVFALEDRHSADDRARFGPTEVTFCRVRGAAQIGYAPALVDTLLATDLDCLHLHGIWMYPSRAGLVWARRTGRPYFISPHGMLDPWITARGRWKKAGARVGYERAAWRTAWAMHALTAKEAADIARESGRRDSLVIPNPAPPMAGAALTPRPPNLIYLGRIHPKKNVLALVAAWRGAKLPDGARLTIAGWGAPQDIVELEAQVDTGPASVEFVGPVFGEAKQRLLESARFMILPSHSEGLPLVVLEAWAAGTPTIMTGECNIPEGFAAGAALECGYDPPAIAQAIEQALALRADKWLIMAHAACALASGRFSTATLSAEWAAVYSRALAG